LVILCPRGISRSYKNTLKKRYNGGFTKDTPRILIFVAPWISRFSLWRNPVPVTGLRSSSFCKGGDVSSSASPPNIKLRRLE